MSGSARVSAPQLHITFNGYSSQRLSQLSEDRWGRGRGGEKGYMFYLNISEWVGTESVYAVNIISGELSTSTMVFSLEMLRKSHKSLFAEQFSEFAKRNDDCVSDGKIGI